MTEGPHKTDIYVGQRIRAARIRAGLSQADVGRAVDVTYQQIQKYENGVTRVSASTLEGISSYLGIPIAEFFPERQSPKSTPPIIIDTVPYGAKLASLFLSLSPARRRLLVDLADILVKRI